MDNLFKLIQKNKKYKQIVKDLLSGKDCHIHGLWGSSSAFLIAGLASNKSPSGKGVILFVTSSIEEAEDAFEDTNVFFPENAMHFPASDTELSDKLCEYNITHVQQLNILHKLLVFKNGNKSSSHIIVTPIQALLQHIPQPETIEKSILTIKTGQEYKQEFLLNWLIEGGFERTSMVEMPGEFSIRGGIVDIYPYSSTSDNNRAGAMPYRIEFFGDEVDSIRMFDIETQISNNEANECQILGVQTSPTNKSKEKANTIIDYLPEGSWIVFKEFENIENKAKNITHNLESFIKTPSFEHIIKSCSNFINIYLSNLPFDKKNIHSFNIKSSDQFCHDVNNSIIILSVSIFKDSIIELIIG